jgi:hypothetical protein
MIEPIANNQGRKSTMRRLRVIAGGDRSIRKNRGTDHAHRDTPGTVLLAGRELALLVAESESHQMRQGEQATRTWRQAGNRVTTSGETSASGEQDAENGDQGKQATG